MRRHVVTLGVMADALGLHASELSTILHGKAHMSIELARAIRAYTGLSLREIFNGQIDGIKAEIEEEKASRNLEPDEKHCEMPCPSWSSWPQPNASGKRARTQIIKPPTKRR